MHENYEDITSRIAEPPTWYDQNGTPRYGPFHPKRCPNIYADQVALLEIACQRCGQTFQVEIHSSIFEELHPQKAHYGDPPIHDCVGDTMNCEDLAVLQVWHRFEGEWIRRPELEGPMT
jgi:hypothetical protein